MLGKCLFGTPYGEPLEQLVTVWCSSICVIGIFVVFCKMGNSGTIHQKISYKIFILYWSIVD